MKNKHRIALAIFCASTSWIISYNACAKSPTLQGVLGFNTVPSARMDDAGTIRTGLSRAKPYTHVFAGAQFSDSIYISFRQSMASAHIGERAEELYPGVDAKIRLRPEGKFWPAIAIGIDSAIGKPELGGEYITLSKQYKKLDFTGGIGWGQYGQNSKFKNPLRHLRKNTSREHNIHKDFNTPSAWFSSDSIGLFAGVEYDLPIDGSSLKLDYSSGGRREDLANTESYSNTPSWGISISYTPKPWINAQIGMQNGDAVMARINLQTNLNLLRRQKTSTPDITALKKKISKAKNENNIIQIDTPLSPENLSTPAQYNAILRNLSKDSISTLNQVTITPFTLGLKDPSLTLLGQSVDKLANNLPVSSEELWKNAVFTIDRSDKLHDKKSKAPTSAHIIDAYYISFENKFSLAEPDNTIGYRSSLLTHVRSRPFAGYLSLGSALRLNLFDNQSNIEHDREGSDAPIHSNNASYSNARFLLENLYFAATKSITLELHTLVTTGYIDENYFGAGTEVLYRPSFSNFAFGAEHWIANRRDPESMANLKLTSQIDESYFIKAWYDLPDNDVTLNASYGKFLNGDTGGTFGALKKFKNGVRLSGEVRISDYGDKDATGHWLQTYHSLRVSIPLGGVSFLPQGSTSITEIHPFSRDNAQTINAPHRLYDLTENFSPTHISTHWDDIVQSSVK